MHPQPLNIQSDIVLYLLSILKGMAVLPAIYLSQSVMEQVALSNQMLYVEIHYIEFSKLLV